MIAGVLGDDFDEGASGSSTLAGKGGGDNTDGMDGDEVGRPRYWTAMEAPIPSKAAVAASTAAAAAESPVSASTVPMMALAPLLPALSNADLEAMSRSCRLFVRCVDLICQTE